jgi:hypothetical protein
MVNPVFHAGFREQGAVPATKAVSGLVLSFEKFRG